jgi:hypothetical protein
MEKDASIGAIMTKPEFEASSDIRGTRSANARVIAIALTVVALVVGPSAVLVPGGFRNLYLALTALSPLAVLLTGVSKGLYTIKLERRATFFNLFDYRKGTVANLDAVFMSPISILCLLALIHPGYVVDWWSAIPAIFAGGGAAALMMLWVRNWISPPALIFLCAGLWGGCTVFLSNEIFDKSSPNVFHTHVTDKHMSASSTGRRTTYHLTIAPWGPKLETGDIRVTHDFYVSLSTGQEICISLHPGAFGVRWYEVDLCGLHGQQVL